jgi:choline transport protein
VCSPFIHKSLHSLTRISTWIALAGSIGIVIPSGGPVAFLYGFIFCVLCNLCLAASLGELSSIWPTAGGQYHYAVGVSSEKWKKTMVSEPGDLYV